MTIWEKLRIVNASRRYWRNAPEALGFFASFALPGADKLKEGRFVFDGGDFYMRPIDFVAFEEIFLGDEYDFIKKLRLPERPDIVDLGANIGLFSLYALSAFPKARVCSVEPMADTFETLRRTNQARGNPDWRVWRYAMWSEDGEVRFRSSVASTGCRIDGAEGEMAVPAISFKTFLEREVPWIERISILKMDIEGAEEAVLEAAGELLARVDNLVIEAHPALCSLERILDILRGTYAHVYDSRKRKSGKPLLLATNADLDLAPYA